MQGVASCLLACSLQARSPPGDDGQGGERGDRGGERGGRGGRGGIGGGRRERREGEKGGVTERQASHRARLVLPQLRSSTCLVHNQLSLGSNKSPEGWGAGCRGAGMWVLKFGFGGYRERVLY